MNNNLLTIANQKLPKSILNTGTVTSLSARWIMHARSEGGRGLLNTGKFHPEIQPLTLFT